MDGVFESEVVLNDVEYFPGQWQAYGRVEFYAAVYDGFEHHEIYRYGFGRSSFRFGCVVLRCVVFGEKALKIVVELDRC